VKKKAKKVQKSVDKYMVLSVYLGMKNDNKKKGNEMSFVSEIDNDDINDVDDLMADQNNDLIGLDDRINESFNGEAESMAREQAMADMMLGGTEFDWQEMQDYANLVTNVMPEAL